MCSARTVSFYTSFGASHCNGGFGSVHTFPVTQQEGFALTCRKPSQCLLDQRNNLVLLQGFVGCRGCTLIFLVSEAIERVKVIAFILRGQRGKQRRPRIPDFLPAVIV